MNITELVAAIQNYAPKPKPYEVKAWNKTVYVKPLTTEQYLGLRDGDDSIPFHVKLVLAGVCDESGKPVFGPEHVPNLNTAVAGPVMELADEVIHATKGIGDTDAKN